MPVDIQPPRPEGTTPNPEQETQFSLEGEGEQRVKKITQDPVLSQLNGPSGDRPRAGGVAFIDRPTFDKERAERLADVTRRGYRTIETCHNALMLLPNARQFGPAIMALRTYLMGGWVGRIGYTGLSWYRHRLHFGYQHYWPPVANHLRSAVDTIRRADLWSAGQLPFLAQAENQLLALLGSGPYSTNPLPQAAPTNPPPGDAPLFSPDAPPAVQPQPQWLPSGTVQPTPPLPGVPEQTNQPNLRDTPPNVAAIVDTLRGFLEGLGLIRPRDQRLPNQPQSGPEVPSLTPAQWETLLPRIESLGEAQIVQMFQLAIQGNVEGAMQILQPLNLSAAEQQGLRRFFGVVRETGILFDRGQFANALQTLGTGMQGINLPERFTKAFREMISTALNVSQAIDRGDYVTAISSLNELARHFPTATRLETLLQQPHGFRMTRTSSGELERSGPRGRIVYNPRNPQAPFRFEASHAAVSVPQSEAKEKAARERVNVLGTSLEVSSANAASLRELSERAQRAGISLFHVTRPDEQLLLRRSQGDGPVREIASVSWRTWTPQNDWQETPGRETSLIEALNRAITSQPQPVIPELLMVELPREVQEQIDALVVLVNSPGVIYLRISEALQSLNKGVQALSSRQERLGRLRSIMRSAAQQNLFIQVDGERIMRARNVRTLTEEWVVRLLTDAESERRGLSSWDAIQKKGIQEIRQNVGKRVPELRNVIDRYMREFKGSGHPTRQSTENLVAIFNEALRGVSVVDPDTFTGMFNAHLHGAPYHVILEEDQLHVRSGAPAETPQERVVIEWNLARYSADQTRDRQIIVSYHRGMQQQAEQLVRQTGWVLIRNGESLNALIMQWTPERPVTREILSQLSRQGSVLRHVSPNRIVHIEDF